MTDGPVYPPRLAVAPLSRPVRATVTVPGSKSVTNRALVLAALTDAPNGVLLTRPLCSDDTQVMIDSLRRLGFAVHDCTEGMGSIRVERPRIDRRVPANRAELFVGNSGTTMRFLTALAALGPGEYRLDGVARMRERPIGDLADALGQLGVSVECEGPNGCPPVVVRSRGIAGGEAAIRSGLSSQFLSGLLMAAPFAEGPVMLRVEGELVSEPYVRMTIDMMRDWGLTVDEPAPGVFAVPAPQRPQRASYAVEPDASAASYFFAAAAVTGGEVTVTGFPERSLQGDLEFVHVLEQMGCTVTRSPLGVRVRAGDTLRGVDVDMNAISDTVMTLGAVALFADGPTNIRNVAHIRHKETDRIAALATELRRLGAAVAEREDGLTITPGPLSGAVMHTYDDHRMAMSLALVGLRVPGVEIDDPGCVAKTYPRFWEDLAALAG